MRTVEALASGPRTMTRERFMKLVQPEPNTGCWLWIGTVQHNGYARVGIARRRHYAHRVAYEMAYGPIGSGLQLDHLCRVRCCVNPDHLEAVTQRENVRRGTGHPGVNARKTHCLRGHALVEGNLYLTKKGARHCRRCLLDKAKTNYLKRKQGKLS